MNRAIRRLAKTCTEPITPWTFEPTGRLRIRIGDVSKELEVGEVYYSDPNYEVGAAIQVGDWVFALRRMVNEVRLNHDPEMWFVSGFHKEIHCNFEGVKHPSLEIRNEKLIIYVVMRFGSIFYPELFEKKKDWGFEWKLTTESVK